jgi:signal transduction histidine kinase
MTIDLPSTRVLLVEDNPGDAALFVRALGASALGKFEVETVSQLSVAVQRAVATNPDIIALDLSLPDSFGIETLQTMRRAAPATPIVVLTGEEDERIGLDALNQGAQDYVVKGDGAGRTIARALLFAIERRLFHEQLNQRDELLAEAQRIAGLGSFDWNPAADRVTWSDELCRIYRVERSNICPTYQGFLELVRLEDRDRVHRLLQGALRAREPFDFEYRILSSDSTRILHSRGHIVLAGTGMPKRVAGTCQDITERRKLEGSLLIASRMSSVGTIASGMAHEINNPLSCVISGLEFIGKELRELDEPLALGRKLELTEAVDQALQGAERVRLIVRSLKTLSRADVQESRRPLHLEDALELAVSLTLKEIRHRARLVKSYGQTPLVDADEARLTQMFVNLLINAAQAIGDGGVDRNEIRIVTSTDPTGRAVAEIRDTGCGISEANRAQIFDPFFTTKPVGLGTGLGLSIVHGIVTAHGGEVTFESPRVGHGTVFRVVLPAATTHAVPALRSSPLPAQAGPGRRGRILVIDDEPMVAGALQRILSVDHDVVTARNGRQAMVRFDRGERFDVILSDVMMPVMSGIDLLEQLARTIPEQAEKLIFISGGAFTPAVKSSLDRIRNRRLEKPFEAHGLRTLVRSLVGA